MKRNFKRVFVASDSHCGHRVGLTPTPYQSRGDSKWEKLQFMLWAWFKEEVEKFKPYDIAILNGDLIDGKGYRSGGSELITADRMMQTRIAFDAFRIVEAPKVRIIAGCLTAGHRVLTSNLRWVPVEELVPGDKILAFDEDYQEHSNRRNWREGVVTNNQPFESDVYTMRLSDGTSITATPDHPFLIRSGKNGSGPNGRRWRTIKELYDIATYSQYIDPKRKKGGYTQYMPLLFPRFLPVWETDNSYEGGYLSGFFDGEGCLSQRLKRRNDRGGEPEMNFTLTAVQIPNAMLDKAIEYLNLKGVQHTIIKHDYRNDTVTVSITGGIAKKLQFLGEIRPKRLLDNFDISKMGNIRGLLKDDTRIVEIYPDGKQTVWGLSTSTKTYISEGFLSHNTPYHSGADEDLEQRIVDLYLSDGIDCAFHGHGFYTINGHYLDVKHKISSSSVHHGRATPLLKEIDANAFWAMDDVEPMADIVIRGHVHYHLQTEQDGRYGFILPSLQGLGDKYGSRQCSSRVDFGFLILDIPEDLTEKIEWDYRILPGIVQRTESEVL